MTLKFKSTLGLIIGATVGFVDIPSKTGWLGRCGTLTTRIQKTPGRAAGQLRKKMKRAGYEEVRL
jgi:hypothetical protein